MQSSTGFALPVQPVRRPSRLNVSAASGGPASLRGSQDLGRAPYDVTPPHHRPPLALRLPGLFRTKIPLVAILPFFLLGYLFAPFNNSLSPDEHLEGSASGFHDETAKHALEGAALNRSWAQRLLYNRGASAATSSSSAARLQPRQHYTEQDGLLYFAPAAPDNDEEGVHAALAGMPKQRHPILYLIEKAENEWEEMLNKQSSTLEEAVKEYTRRYKRPPPAGFDKWWDFAQKHDVQLPDEYDMINKDIEPFLSLPPRVFKSRVHQLVRGGDFHLGKEAFTVNIKGGSLTLSGPHGEFSRARETKELMDGIAGLLPDMQIVFTAHDGPGVFLSGEAKKQHVEYARAGKFLSERQYENRYEINEFPGWTAGCPAGSNWRRSLFGNAIQKPSTHSFVTDVEASSDVCNHPNIGSQHGFFLWTGPGPELLYPLFTWAKTAMHSDILVTPLEQYYTEVGPDPAWEDKRHNKLLWRGSNTGAAYHRESRWRSSQRARLVLLAQDEGVDKTVHHADARGVLRAVKESQGVLNKRYMDVAFSGRPAQCDEGDGSCAILRKVFDFKSGMGQEEANEYKYVFDVDGNGWSGRFHRLMASNAAILKATIFPEWYQQRIKPWVHYIPVKVDYTDLYDILGFFMGGEEGEDNHDDLAKKIAQQGQDWAKYHWREADMQSYLLRLFLEYGRLLTRTEDDLEKGDYVAA